MMSILYEWGNCPIDFVPFFLFFIIVFFIRIYGGVISLTAAIPYAEIKETQVYSRPALSIYDWLSRPDSFPAMASKFLFLSLSLYFLFSWRRAMIIRIYLYNNRPCLAIISFFLFFKVKGKKNVEG